MTRGHSGTNIDRSEFYGAMQRIVDGLFYEAEQVQAGGAAADARAVHAASATDGRGAVGAARALGEAGAPGTCGAQPAEATPHASFAERLGIAPDTAALLGLAAFDEPVCESQEPSTFTVRRLDVVIAAETADLPDELMRIVTLLPPGDYTRQRLCDQINSAITGHAWGQVYGTVS